MTVYQANKAKVARTKPEPLVYAMIKNEIKKMLLYLPSIYEAMTFVKSHLCKIKFKNYPQRLVNKKKIIQSFRSTVSEEQKFTLL